ncbi:zinc-finger domain-containing protein [Brevibacillus parabrevis]|uniref:zinc-finger domain-containing protein n=1 Tax=Brevibacillus parabrevis TaxID=54914 RepID=UPI0028532901|nr:zinc-finger domain-containing protein [Brevibacillus parabrevis]MDR4997876.1 zinc-finger domain-containing protein [Brevibacillus parabrevis]
MAAPEVDRKKQRETRIAIGDLIERHCKGCSTYAENHKQFGQSQAQGMCTANCGIGKQLFTLGQSLLTERTADCSIEADVSMDERKKVNGLDKTLTKETYLGLCASTPDYKIANQYNISTQTLIRWKKEWGIQVRRKHPAKTPSAHRSADNPLPNHSSDQKQHKEAKREVNSRMATLQEVQKHGIKTILDQTEWFLDSKLPTVPSISLNKQGIWFNAAATKEMGLIEGELVQVGISTDKNCLVFRKGSTGLKLKLASSPDALQITNKRLAAWLDGKRVKNKQYALERDQLTGVWISRTETVAG